MLRCCPELTVDHQHLHRPQDLADHQHLHCLQDLAYWSSWALTIFGQLAVSGLLCAIICMYPFVHSNFLLVLGLLWLISAALIAYAFFLSTFFNAARVAGQVAVIVYVASIVPG